MIRWEFYSACEMWTCARASPYQASPNPCWSGKLPALKFRFAVTAAMQWGRPPNNEHAARSNGRNVCKTTCFSLPVCYAHRDYPREPSEGLAEVLSLMSGEDAIGRHFTSLPF